MKKEEEVVVVVEKKEEGNNNNPVVDSCSDWDMIEGDMIVAVVVVVDMAVVFEDMQFVVVEEEGIVNTLVEDM